MFRTAASAVRSATSKLAAAGPTACSSNSIVPTASDAAHSLTFKRGALSVRLDGGRSSVSGIVATVFGSTGFLGRYVVNQLGKIGSQIVVTYRGDDECVRHLKLMGDLGQIVPLPIALRDRDSIARAIYGSNVVINLIGSKYETRNFNFYDVHAKGPQLIAEVSKELGVERLVHLSALSVGKDLKSDIAKSKAEGEEAVLETLPGATIIRPGPLYGAEDKFLNVIAFGSKQLPFQIRVAGGETLVQPAYVGDVARGVLHALSDPSTAGKTYELAGPDVFRMYDLYELVFKETNLNDNVLDVPFSVARFLAAILEKSPLTPILTRDQVKQLETDVVRNPRAPGFMDLGITKLAAFEPTTTEYLKRFRKGGFLNMNVIEADHH